MVDKDVACLAVLSASTREMLQLGNENRLFVARYTKIFTLWSVPTPVLERAFTNRDEQVCPALRLRSKTGTLLITPNLCGI